MRGKRVIIGVAIIAVVGLVVLWPGSPVREAGATVANWRECWSWSAKDEGPRAVALGDSITEGHHSDTLRVNAIDSYYDVLTCREDSPIAYVANEGVGGQTSDEILDRVPDVLDHDPEVVLVVAGTNDVLEDKSTDETFANLTAIRDGLADGGVEQIIFGSLPPSNETPAENVTFNAALDEWAAGQDVTLVDLWTPLAADDGTYAEGMNVDQHHPSAAGAERLADAAAAALEGLS